MGNDHGHNGQGDSANAGHDSHGDSHGGGHGDGAPNFPFGEVIPEKNWQESALVVFCMVVLVGFVWLFFQFMSVPIPAVVAEGGDEVNAQRSEHAVKAENDVKVIGAPEHAPQQPAVVPSNAPAAAPAASTAIPESPAGSTK